MQNFAWCAKFMFSLALQHLVSQGLQNFAQGVKFLLFSLALYPAAGAPLGISHAMRNC